MSSQKADLTRATVHGAIWAYTSNYSGKILAFISTVILARLLIKEDFGVAGYALVIISFLNLPGLGIGPALIYFDKETKRTNTAFWLSLVMGFALFGLTWFIAPLAGYLFNDPRSIPVTRALALTFVLSSFGAVHSAFLQKELAFKRKFIPEFIQSITKGLVSITLALLGFGAWSLIIGQLAGEAATTIALWIVFPWRPSLEFHLKFARPLLSYSLSIASVFVFGILLLNVDYVFVGRFLGAAALGVYTLAFRIPELLIKQFSGIVGTVLFPVYAKMRDNPQALKRGFLTTLRYVSMITIPLGLGLALVSEPFILTVFGQKWAEAIPVMSGIAIYTLLRSLAFNVGDIYKAQGRPDLLSKQSFLHIVLLVPALWIVITYFGTLTAIAWTQAIVALFIVVIRLVIATRLLDTPFRSLLETLRPIAFAGGFMSLAVLIALHFTNGMLPIIQLIISVAVGALVYTSMLWWLQQDLVMSGINTLRVALAKR